MSGGAGVGVWPRLIAAVVLPLALACASPAGGASERLEPGGASAARSSAPSSATAVVVDPCHQGGQEECVINPQVTEANLGATICATGWMRTVRPPVQYTDRLKREQMAQLGLVGSPADYEEDHRLPLELGGDPRAPHNLTPEPHSSSSGKDQDENVFRHRVCSGEPLKQAQSEFVAKWLSPWPAYRQ